MQTSPMTSAADVIERLEAVSSRTAKEGIIQSAWDQGIIEFFEGAKMAYDALRTYGVKKVPLITDEGTESPQDETSLSWERFKNIAMQLESRQLSGNTARDVLRAAASIANTHDWNGFYRRILLKDFKCGITETTVNKILEKNGPTAKQYLIPVFSCQLAKNGEDHPEKLTGPKLLDVKLDGVRIISVLDKDKNTVTQYSRNGRINENFPQITASLGKLLPHITESMVLDGEMVSRNFQALMKQLNRKDDVDTSDAKLALFDCLPLAAFIDGECMLTQLDRHNALSEFQPLLDSIAPGQIYVVPKLAVDLSTAQGQASLREFNISTIDAGYEGVMIKDPASTYRTKRTDAWLKIKPWITVDLEIIDVEPGKPESKFSQTLGGLVCRGTEDGKLIEVTVGGGYSEELRDEIWTNRASVIGRIVEIKGDALTKSQNGESWSLRFPVFLGFRGQQPGEKI